MAKKKSKKKNKNLLSLVLMGAACVFGLTAFCMIFADAISYGVGKATTTVTGLKTAFGYKEDTILGEVEILSVNALAMLAYLLPFAGIILALLGRNSKLFTFLSAAAFVVAGVFAFLMATTFPATVVGSELIKLEAKLAIGAILSGVFSILAGLCMLAKLAKK